MIEKRGLKHLEEDIELAFEELIHQQRQRVFSLARRLKPNVTMDDITDPHSFPELIADAQFNYEEGYLEGLMAAQVSLRRKVLKPHAEGREPEPPNIPEDSPLQEILKRRAAERHGGR